MNSTCTHLNEIREVSPSTLDGCEDCLKIGGQWVHLRICLACGHIGCCDSSPNRHARQHAGTIGHAIAGPFQEPADWRWCFVDEIAV